MKAITKLKSKINRKFWRVIRLINPRAYVNYLASDPHDFMAQEDSLCFETRYWLKRAYKVHVSVQDVPLGDLDSHWDTAYDGERYIQYNSLRKLKKLIEDAEYENKKRSREGSEIFIKYFTALAALVAALTAIANLIISSH